MYYNVLYRSLLWWTKLSSLTRRSSSTDVGVGRTVTVYNRATIKGLIYPYDEYYPAVTEWGQYPTCTPKS